ncbi:MAG: alpha/beta fold hydrolase [Actinomycetota bacterium]
MTLASRTLAPTDPGRTARRLVLAHGFTQNADCWGPFAERLAAEHEVVLVDGPGHGRSGHDSADLWEAAELLTEVGDRAIYVGYSMGGRTALHAALARPDLVDGLVLIGATPGLGTDAERQARRDADGELADRLLSIGLPAFLDRWLAQPLFAGLDEEAAARPARERNRVDGLAASLRHCGTGNQESLWGRLDEVRAPVLAVVGDRDRKFTDIAERMVAALAAAPPEAVTGGSGADGPDRSPARRPTLRSLPGTHAVHLERPVDTAAAVLDHIAGW